MRDGGLEPLNRTTNSGSRSGRARLAELRRREATAGIVVDIPGPLGHDEVGSHRARPAGGESCDRRDVSCRAPKRRRVVAVEG